MVSLTDLRIAARTLRRQPGIALVAIIALGLGIGLPAAMYSLARGIAFRGLPVEEGTRIMSLERRPKGARGEGWGVAPKDFVTWTDQQRSFEALAATETGTVAFRVDRGAWRYNAAYLSANAFEILRKQAAIGRVFQPGEDQVGAEPVVILGHEVWRDRFASDPAAIGRTVYIDGREHTVIGVMEAGFRFPVDEDLWLPYVLPVDAAVADGPTFSVFGRLNPGTGPDAARSDFARIAEGLATRFPDTNATMGVAIKPFTERYIGETPVATMRVMMGAVLLVLIIACTNVANLLLVRAVHRIRELAVRAALGASRRRIATQMLLESSMLAVLGGLVGVGVAYAANGTLMRWIGTDRMPYWSDIRLDGRVLLFAIGLTVAAGLLAGLLPAIRAMGANVNDIIKDQSRGASGFRTGRVMQALIVVEIAISLGLLVNTGLMLRSVRNVRNVSLGFPVDRLITAHVTLPARWDDGAVLRFSGQLQSRVAVDPAALHTTLTTSIPTSRAATTRLAVEGNTYSTNRDMPLARHVVVSTGFFTTFAARPVSGRDFGPLDDASGERVAIVNERFVTRILAGRDPIGARVRLGNLDSPGEWMTIVGVVPDIWAAGLDASGDRNPPAVYAPLAQTPSRDLSVAVETRDAPAIAASIREAVAALDPDVPVYDVKSMNEVIGDNSWFYGFGVGIVGACGLAALLLAAVGLYGVIAFSVGRRTREFGIRMALGAAPASIRSLVVRRGSLQLVIGAVIGFGLAYTIANGVASLLFQVSPADPVTFIAAGLMLVGIAQLATFVPAIRASRVDPLTALRNE
jgi:putative ABC transport system permease protein